MQDTKQVDESFEIAVLIEADAHLFPLKEGTGKTGEGTARRLDVEEARVYRG